MYKESRILPSSECRDLTWGVPLKIINSVMTAVLQLLSMRCVQGKLLGLCKLATFNSEGFSEVNMIE